LLNFLLNVENLAGNLCTYERVGMGSSNIDVTLSTFVNELMQKITIEYGCAKTIDEQAISITKALQAAANASIPFVKAGCGRQPWWTDELSLLKNILDRLKRAGAHRNDRQTYTSCRNKYLHEL